LKIEGKLGTKIFLKQIAAEKGRSLITGRLEGKGGLREELEKEEDGILAPRGRFH